MKAKSENNLRDRAAKQIIARFPALFSDGKKVPFDLVGSTIVAIGTTGEAGDSENFVIDYQPRGCDSLKRVVMLFNDRGMWLDSKITMHSPSH